MSYEWIRLDDDLIELRENYNKRARYTKRNLERTIANIKANRSGYATQQAYERRLSMYESARDVFDKGGG